MTKQGLFMPTIHDDTTSPPAAATSGARAGRPADALRRYEVGVPAGSLELMVDGVRLAVAREGKGLPVICLHAIGHGGGDYDAFAGAMCDRFEIIRIDWPAQGRSGPDGKAATPARYAELLRGVVEQLRLDTPVIIGCSIGGATAIRYASEHPVRALVLANSGGLVEMTGSVQRACLFGAGIFAAGARRAWWYKAFFAAYYRLVLPTPAAAAQRRRIVASAYEIAPVLEDAWRHFAIAEEFDQRQRLWALHIPILVAWAMNDRINQFKIVAPAIAETKHARLAKFAAGHAAFLERAEEFVREFSAFLAENDLASG
ncbi:MAG: alpha/beta hydrolase [Bradyrhizobium sp.]|nr:alpha/beta hydrolase [Bradyrhizobium sp.]